MLIASSSDLKRRYDVWVNSGWCWCLFIICLLLLNRLCSTLMSLMSILGMLRKDFFHRSNMTEEYDYTGGSGELDLTRQWILGDWITPWVILSLDPVYELECWIELAVVEPSIASICLELILRFYFACLKASKVVETGFPLATQAILYPLKVPFMHSIGFSWEQLSWSHCSLTSTLLCFMISSKCVLVVLIGRT